MTYTNHTNQFSAASAMHNYIITTDNELKKTSDYKKVALIVHKLIEGGVTFAAKGYCISMSDIIYTLLKQNKIPCKIVECHLAITSKVNNQIYTVGFDGLKDDPNKADTHVVVVTETEIPMVIDVSIAHLLPNNIQGVIDKVIDDEHGVFANIDTQMVALTYQKKKEFSIPMLHQRSIVDRIQTDVNIFKSLKALKIMIIIALSVSTLNATRGFYDFYLIYEAQNDWGPNSIREIIKKVDSISVEVQKLTVPKK
jgi:hypothetical protein